MRILEPRELLAVMDFKEDEFSIKDFGASREKAVEMVMNLRRKG